LFLDVFTIWLIGKRKQLRSRKRWSCYWLLLAAIHDAGLVSLTHTPSPMNFISKILNRPENEKPFYLSVGYP
jgi:hypothetical protein